MEVDKKRNHMVYYSWYLDIRAGGPTGYLANLRYGLDRVPNDDGVNVWLCAQKKPIELPKKKESRIKSFLTGLPVIKFLNANYFSKDKKKYLKDYTLFLENNENVFMEDDAVEFIKEHNIEMIHCHVVMDVLKAANTLRREGLEHTKIMLTSHVPEAPSIENYNLVKDEGYAAKKLRRFKKAWQIVEEKAFKLADIWVFPSREAMEPYYETLPDFAKWAEKKDVRFVPTGAQKLKSSLSREEARNKYGLKEDDLAVVYIGRHIEVKGYDLLLEAGAKLLKQNSKVVFLIGGKRSSTLSPLKDKRWKELGWINPADLLTAADVFVLPNKRTYFDLILLEVLSLGVPVIASSTGGNKSVQDQTGALMLCDANSLALADKIEQFSMLDKTKISEIRNNLLQAYENYYTPEVFAQNYIKLLREIYSDYPVGENK